MMKKWLFLCLFLAGTSSIMRAQKTMRDCFVNMPDSVLRLLTKNNRLDCVDFLDSKMPAVVRNVFDGKSELKELTDNYLQLNLSTASRVELLLLPAQDTAQIICMIRSYDGPKTDCSLQFYDTNWRKLPTSDFIDAPAPADYWQPAASGRADDLRRAQLQIDIPLIKITPVPADPMLRYELNLDVLTKTARPLVEPYVRPVLYRWQGRRFMRQ